MTFTSPLLRHHSVLIVDIAGFGRCGRRAQWVARRTMTSVVRETLRHIGVDWRPGDGDELGDGLRVLLPAGMPKTLLAHPWPGLLVQALHRHNANRPAEERVRLRVAIGVAEVEFDGTYAASPAVIEAFRMVDAAPLKRMLARSPGPLALVVSQHFYREVVQRVPDAHAEAYRAVRVRTKEGPTIAWITAPEPDPGAPAGPARNRWWRRRPGYVGLSAVVAVAVLSAMLAGITSPSVVAGTPSAEPPVFRPGSSCR
ncbi:MAG: hypothetical protein ACJ72N_09460 [Labedaea sp.]